jgi:hypothetical protein
MYVGPCLHVSILQTREELLLQLGDRLLLQSHIMSAANCDETV